MVQATESILGERLTAGIAICPRGSEGPTERTVVHGGGHPLPDPGSLMATRHIARLLEQSGPEDLVLVLLSGGASALMEQPAGRIPLIDLQAATSSLLGSGARIDEINALRKHISRVKGGGLAAMAAPSPVLGLILSDVVGSPLESIASGPTAPDPSRFSDAGAVLSRLGLWGAMPASIGQHLRDGMAGRIPETPKPGDALFDRVHNHLIGDGASALEAARDRAGELGFRTSILTTYLEGEAREVGRLLAAVAKESSRHGRPLAPPACILASGETTVTLRRLGGRGGRNQELALAAALALDAEDGSPITLAALGSDGIDGQSEAAGAIVDGDTARRARAAGLDPVAALAGHDSAPFFESLGQALVTGPTGTNVGDLVLLLVGQLDRPTPV